MLVKNARIVLEGGVFTGDLRTDGEVFSEIDPSLLPRDGEAVVRADGMMLLPGGVDVHTHMDLDVGTARATDDFYSGTVAAACGGTTTIVDHMAFGDRGFSISSQLDRYHNLADGNAVIDYGFHGVLDHVDKEILKEIETLARQGVTSHKFYLTYDGKISDAEAFALMLKAKETGVILAVHPENDGIVNYLRDMYVDLGKTSPVYHALSRPPESEAEAVNRMILLARMAGDAPIYIVHLTNSQGLEYIKLARLKGQKNLFAETCPQYLLLDDSRYLEPDGLKYIMSPPLRKKDDNDALWQGIIDGDIQTVATDHCPFFYEKEKQMGKNDFTKTPNGAPGVEARMMLMYSEGVAKGRIPPEHMARICCTKPARLFGLYPKKGTVKPGSDADFVIIDPERRKRLTKPDLHENCDYTPYEGLDVTGWPIMTVSRGKIVAQNGKFTGKKGAGRYLKRKLPELEKQ